MLNTKLVLFRDAKRAFGDWATIAVKSTMVPNEYYFLKQKKLIIIILKSSHKYLSNYEFSYNWMVVHV